MLETGRVCGGAGDGHVHALVAHDRHALIHIVRAVAAHLGPVAFGERAGGDDLQLAGMIIVLGLDMRKAVDARDDIRRILAKAVQDDLQRLLADLVGRARDADGPFGGGKALMPGEEGEAMRLLAQQHGRQIAMAAADRALIRNRTGDAERLQPDADLLGRLGGGLDALLERNRGARGIRPAGVLKRDGLNAAHDAGGIHARLVADALGVLKPVDAMLGEDGVDLVDPSFVAFKRNHAVPPLTACADR